MHANTGKYRERLGEERETGELMPADEAVRPYSVLRARKAISQKNREEKNRRSEISE